VTPAGRSLLDLIFCLASSVVKFSSPNFLTISPNALCLASFLVYSVLFMLHIHSCSLYSSTYMLTHHPPCRNFKYWNCTTTTETNICTDLLVAHYWQVGVHMRQVKGRLPAGIGRRQAASNISLLRALNREGSERITLPTCGSELPNSECDEWAINFRIVCEWS